MRSPESSVPPGALSHLALEPFGRVVEAQSPGADLRRIPYQTLSDWTEQARVLVLRGFNLLGKSELVEFCSGWGEILRWDFGEVLDLVIQDSPKNYLFTRGDVPFHWDGAFAAATPRYFMFQCLDASPGGGGETVFCDTTMVWRDASAATRRQWQQLTVSYATEKIEHYGGQVTVPLVASHPSTGLPTLRFAEPLDPGDYLNPLFLQVTGMPEEEAPAFVDDLSRRLHQPTYCYPHAWRSGDIVIADNHALVHGRNPFTDEATRHLQRIQII